MTKLLCQLELAFFHSFQYFMFAYSMLFTLRLCIYLRCDALSETKVANGKLVKTLQPKECEENVASTTRRNHCYAPSPFPPPPYTLSNLKLPPLDEYIYRNDRQVLFLKY